MKNINYKTELILWLMLVAPIIYGIYVWGQLPDHIAIHFDLKGTPNGWGGRWAIFLTPVISIFTYALLLFLPQVDPKRTEDYEYTSMFSKIRVAVVIFLSAISVFITYNAISPFSELGIGRLMPVVAFLFISVFGNFMINIKPNWFIGIRTPWTLSSDTVWRRTHQVVGRLWFYGGLVCAILCFCPANKWTSALILAFLIGSVVFAFVYSFLLYKQEQKRI